MKQLIGGFSLGWFLIVILKRIAFCDRRVKEFEVLNCSVNIFVLFHREVHGSKHFSRSQFLPSCYVAVRPNYSSDTLSRLNFEKKN